MLSAGAWPSGPTPAPYYVVRSVSANADSAMPARCPTACPRRESALSRVSSPSSGTPSPAARTRESDRGAGGPSPHRSLRTLRGEDRSAASTLPRPLPTAVVPSHVRHHSRGCRECASARAEDPRRRGARARRDRRTRVHEDASRAQPASRTRDSGRATDAPPTRTRPGTQCRIPGSLRRFRSPTLSERLEHCRRLEVELAIETPRQREPTCSRNCSWRM